MYPTLEYRYSKLVFIFLVAGLSFFLALPWLPGFYTTPGTLTFWIKVAYSAIVLSGIVYSAKNGLIPAIQNKVMIRVDESGIFDAHSWGLISWSNIKSIKLLKNEGDNIDSFSLGIELQDIAGPHIDTYTYNYKQGGYHIGIETTWIKGDSDNIFNEVNGCFLRMK